MNIPKILYGTAWKKEKTADLVVAAVKTGFRGIDTACQPKHYNEPQVGEALKRLNADGIERESLFVQTKFTPLNGQDPNNIPYDRNAPIEIQVAQSFETSKKNLQTNYVDSLVLHSAIAPHETLMKVWSAMENINKNGEAHKIGISNCYNLNILKQLYNDAEIKPSFLQNRFYQQSNYDVDLRNWCSEHKIVYQSFWSLTANPHALMNPTVMNIAKFYNKTSEQIFFRFLNQLNIVPLTGTTSGKHMVEDLNIFDFELKTEDIERINKILLVRY